jgi:hypothetical protein
MGNSHSIDLGVGVQSVLDLVDIIIGQTSEADGVVAEWNGVALVELASDDGGKIHASGRHTADNDGWKYLLAQNGPFVLI